MKHISDTAAKALKHRVWHWCRRPNGFCDRPAWRVLAAQLQLPLYQVIAFVNRLEELANAAEQRGSVIGFSAAEFGVALGMSEEEAARIFAGLEDPSIGWVAYDHVADFHDRNRDWEDDTAAARQRRKRARDDILKRLVKLSRVRKVTAERRDAIEARLMLMELDELVAIQGELRRAELSTDAVRHTVTPRDGRDGHDRAEHRSTARPVDNSGADVPGEEKGPSDDGAARPENDPQAEALRWIEAEGRQLVVERMSCLLTQADMYLQRWLHQALEGDAPALVAILKAEERAGYIGPRFHTNVTDAIARHARLAQGRADLQRILPLGGIQPNKKSA